MDARQQQAEVTETLRRAVRLALEDGSDNWTEAPTRRAVAVANRIARDLFDRTLTRESRIAIRDTVEATIAAANRKREDRDAQAVEIATALAAYLGTAVMDAGTDATWDKVWNSVDDDKVRPSHREASGQRVPADQPFTVGGHEMTGPHDLSAPIGEWAGCRCWPSYERRETEPEAIVAAAMNPAEEVDLSAFVIVGLPAEDDPVNDIVGTVDPAHVTLLYLSADYLDQAAQIIAGEAPKWEPFVLPTGERGELGDGGADVVHVEPGTMADLRDALLGYEPIAQGYDAVEQFPEWTPHVTVGYPETPALEGEVPPTIVIDRIAILHDGLRDVHPLGEAMTETPTEAPPEAPVEDEFASDAAGYDEVPLYGVLAPEGISTGDGRHFAADSLVWIEPPLSMRWQKVDQPAHDGSVVTARIDRIWRDAPLIKWEGAAVMSVEADEMVGLIAERALRGVSVDLDGPPKTEMRYADGSPVDIDALMAELEADPDMQVDVVEAVTYGRIRSAAVCPIPAFPEAFIAIGTWADHDPVVEEEVLVASTFAISDKAWDGSASRFTDEEWKRSCIVHLSDAPTKSDHKVPIKEPNGDLSRAGVHAAASRIGQVDAPPDKIAAAKRSLRGAYKQLGEEPPESLTAAAVEPTPESLLASAADILAFAPGTEDGPGWLTHPVDTDRLRDYWVRGPGAAKIGWGAPGDFNRCRVHLTPYVKPQHLAGYCANRHKDALGIWPGEHAGGSIAASAAPDDPVEPMFHTLLASATEEWPAAPLEWFQNPNLGDVGAFTITKEGRAFGYVAEFDTCHTAYDECVLAPKSPTDYSWFLNKAYVTREGETINVGVITLGTGHAPGNASARMAAAHYDNTGTALVDVVVGEDARGIWCAGAVRPWATEKQVRELRGAVLSGDWRTVRYRGRAYFDMIAVLAVNSGGFPLPRVALAASAAPGEDSRLSLVAAGVVPNVIPETKTVEQIVAEAITAREELATVRASVITRRRKQLAAIRAEIKGDH